MRGNSEGFNLCYMMMLFAQFFCGYTCVVSMHVDPHRHGCTLWVNMWTAKVEASMIFLLLSAYSWCRISHSDPGLSDLFHRSTDRGLELQASNHCHQAFTQLWSPESQPTFWRSKLLTIHPSPQTLFQQVSRFHGLHYYRLIQDSSAFSLILWLWTVAENSSCEIKEDKDKS